MEVLTNGAAQPRICSEVRRESDSPQTNPGDVWTQRWKIQRERMKIEGENMMRIETGNKNQNNRTGKQIISLQKFTA